MLLAEGRAVSASETLAEWERDHGLPDACAPFITLAGQRRAVLLAKVRQVGDQSRPRLHEIAAKHGETIQITEYAPGDTVPGHPEVAAEEAAYVVQINLSSELSISTFGLARAGREIRYGGGPRLIY